MDNLIKIIAVLDKPYHYLMIGIFLVCWKYFLGSELDLYFWGGIFIVISFASFFEKTLNILLDKYQNSKKQKLEKEKITKLKQYYITEYNNMNKKEKSVIDYCIANRTLMYTSPLFSSKEEVSHIYSLVGKRFGQNVTYGGDFMLNQSCYDILIRYLNEKENPDD